MENKNGFTLIEMMIVIVIIAILATIAIPQYQRYVIRTQIIRGYAEMNSLRTAVEVCESEGSLGNECSLDNVQSSLYLENPTVSFKPSIIRATFGLNAHPKLQNTSIELERSLNSSWECTFTVTDELAKNLIPKGCTLE